MTSVKKAFLFVGIPILVVAAVLVILLLPRGDDLSRSVRGAADLIQSGKKAEGTSSARAVRLYEKALAILENSTARLKEDVLPRARLKAEAEKDPLACAYLVSQTIPDVHFRAFLLASIAAGYAEAGDRERASRILAEALELAEREENDFLKVQNLSSIALRHADTVEEGKSAEILSRAIEVAEGIGGPDWTPAVLSSGEGTYRKRSALAILSEAFDTTKEVLGIGGGAPWPDEPEDAADRRRNLTPERRKRLAAFGISSSCIRSGRYDEALRATELMPGASEKMRSLCKLAGKLAEGGEEEKASMLLAQAHNLVEGTESDSPDRYSLVTVAGTYAGIGLEDRALEIADEVADEVTKAAIQAAAAEHLFKAGRREKAEELLKEARSFGESIISGSDRSTVLGYIEQAESAMAEQYAADGQYDEAVRLADGIGQPSRKGELLLKIARTLSEANQKERALETLSQAAQAAKFVEKDYAREWFWVDLGAAYFEVGEKQKASQYVSDAIHSARKRKDGPPYYHMESAACEYVRAGKNEVAFWLAGQIRNPAEKNRVIVEIARTCFEAGKPEEALRILERVQTRWLENHLLLRTAEVYAANGRYLDALRLARSITETLWKAQALADIGRELGKSGGTIGKAERKILRQIVKRVD